MIVPYFPEESASAYRKYYADQVGHGISVFRGSTIHTGAGIGSFLGSLAKSALPLLKSGGKAIGRQLLSTGASIASDVLQGKNIKDSSSSRFKEAGGNLLGNLVSGLSNPRMEDYDEIDSLPRPRKRRRKSTKGKKKQNSDSLFQNVHVSR